LTDDKLELLLADGIIDSVLGRLRGGKEADVWIVEHAGEAVAAKIYKERQARSFRNNADYKEGRQVADSRTQRAMARGSRFGQAAAEQAWKSAEADALYKLHAAGVRTPAPVMFFEGVLLMQLVVDAEGNAAPRLIDAQPTPEQAAELYRDLRSQVVRMLVADLIHGDLSPYNVLLAAGGPTVIDFPQTLAAAHNSRAEFFFTRDLENLRKHLEGFAPELSASAGDAREIWRAYVRRELTPDFVPSGRVPEETKQRADRPPRRERADRPPRQARAELPPRQERFDRRSDQRPPDHRGQGSDRRAGANPPRRAAPEAQPAVPGPSRQRQQPARPFETDRNRRRQDRVPGAAGSERPRAAATGQPHSRPFEADRNRQQDRVSNPGPLDPRAAGAGQPRPRPVEADRNRRQDRVPGTSGPQESRAADAGRPQQPHRADSRPNHLGRRQADPRSSDSGRQRPDRLPGEQRPPQSDRPVQSRPRPSGPVVERINRLAETGRPAIAGSGSMPARPPRDQAQAGRRRRSGGMR
jgi:RIO kinase 1